MGAAAADQFRQGQQATRKQGGEQRQAGKQLKKEKQLNEPAAHKDAKQKVEGSRLVQPKLPAQLAGAEGAERVAQADVAACRGVGECGGVGERHEEWLGAAAEASRLRSARNRGPTPAPSTHPPASTPSTSSLGKG